MENSTLEIQGFLSKSSLFYEGDFCNLLPQIIYLTSFALCSKVLCFCKFGPVVSAARRSQYQANKCWIQEAVAVLKHARTHSFPASPGQVTNVVSCSPQSEWSVFRHQKLQLIPGVPLMTSQQVCFLWKYVWYEAHCPRSSGMKSLIP